MQRQNSSGIDFHQTESKDGHINDFNQNDTTPRLNDGNFAQHINDFDLDQMEVEPLYDSKSKKANNDKEYESKRKQLERRKLVRPLSLILYDPAISTSIFSFLI